MARPNRHLDVEHVERLIADRDLAIKDIARKMARSRYRRAPNEKEVENARRSLQRWLEGNGIEPRGQQLLAKALGEPVEALLLPQELAAGVEATQPAPIAVMQAMQQALENQHTMQKRQAETNDRLEALEGAAAAIAEAVDEVRSLLRAAQSPGQAGRG